MQRFDVWLERTSHLSQTVLALVTAGTLYFTVVPLYQKALLEEAIAKKETELKEANAGLERAYERARAAAVAGYGFSAGAKCSGLLEPLPPLPVLGKTSKSRDLPMERVSAFNTAACLRAEAGAFLPLQELRPRDKKLFDQRLSQIADELESQQKNAISSLQAVNVTNSDPPTSMSPFDEGYLNYLRANGATPSQIAHERLVMAVNKQKEKIASEYFSTLHAKVISLKSIPWDTTPTRTSQ